MSETVSKEFYYKGLITPETAIELSNQLDEYLKTRKYSHKTKVSARIMFESVLDSILDEIKDQKTFIEIEYAPHMRGDYLRIIYMGPKWVRPNVGGSDYSAILLSNAYNRGINLFQRYMLGCNEIRVILPKRELNPILVNVFAMLAAVATFIFLNLLPTETGNYLVDNIFQPTFDAFFNLLSGTAMIMIFISVIRGIANMGSLSILSHYGKTTGEHYIRRVFASIILACLIIVPTTGIVSGRGSLDLKVFAEIYKMVLDILPRNIAEPFYNSNSLQITFIAAAMGIIMLGTSSHNDSIYNLLDELDSIVSKAISVICDYSWICVYLSIEIMLLNGSFLSFLHSYRIILYILAQDILLMVFVSIESVLRYKDDGIECCKGSMPIGLQGFATSSSLACMDMIYDFVQKKFGVQKEFLDFAFPMGQLIYKPELPVSLMIIPLVLCDIYGIQITIVQLLAFCIIVYLLVVATPAIPGGSLISMAVVFNYLGLPPEAIAIAIAISPFEDMISTGAKCYTYSHEILAIHKKMNGK